MGAAGLPPPVLGVHRIASTESQRLGLRKGQREAYDRNPLCPLCSTSDQDETARIFRRLPRLALSRKASISAEKSMTYMR